MCTCGLCDGLPWIVSTLLILLPVIAVLLFSFVEVAPQLSRGVSPTRPTSATNAKEDSGGRGVRTAVKRRTALLEAPGICHESGY